MTEKIRKFNTGFTQVSNQVLTDPRITLKAKAVYAYLFSKPDGWVFHMSAIEKEIKETRNTLYSAIKELIKFGYIKRNQTKEKGRFGGIEYEFIDISPYTKKPHTEKPYTENWDTNNTNKIKNKKYSNTPPTPLEGDDGGIVSIITYFNHKKPEDVKRGEIKRLKNWMRDQNINLSFLVKILQFWIDNKDIYDYPPQISSLGEMMVKFGGLIRFYENNHWGG